MAVADKIRFVKTLKGDRRSGPAYANVTKQPSNMELSNYK